MGPVTIPDDRMILQAQVCLDLPRPAHDTELPKGRAVSLERGGQRLRRQSFQYAVERAGAALVLAQRHGKQGQGIRCRGTTLRWDPLRGWRHVAVTERCTRRDHARCMRELVGRHFPG